MRIIRLGKLKPEGDASEHLLACLSGCELPLAGVVAEAPYVRGAEVLEDYSHLLHTADVYLVKKDKVIQALRNVSQRAIAEIKDKYSDLVYLPFRRRFCEIVM